MAKTERITIFMTIRYKKMLHNKAKNKQVHLTTYMRYALDNTPVLIETPHAPGKYTEPFMLPCTPEEKTTIENKAAAHGLTVANYIVAVIRSKQTGKLKSGKVFLFSFYPYIKRKNKGDEDAFWLE